MNKLKDFDVIVYHGPCSDGTGGLWAACHYKPINIKCSCKAGSDPQGDFTGMNVIFVDICPRIEYLKELTKIAKNVVILDHHKSSEQMILDNDELFKKMSNLHIEFDMNRSGCQMAWDYFFDVKTNPRPFFIDYIGDRDLWTWKLPSSREINAGLFELGYIDSFDLSKLSGLLENSEEKKKYLESYGKIISTINKKEIDIGISKSIEAQMICSDKTYKIWLGGNFNSNLRSELGNALCLKSFEDGSMPDFSAFWQYDPKSDEWWISLRGIADRSPDLSVIASKFGGGGHSLASGITIKNNSNGLKSLFIF